MRASSMPVAAQICDLSVMKDVAVVAQGLAGQTLAALSTLHAGAGRFFAGGDFARKREAQVPASGWELARQRPMISHERFADRRPSCGVPERLNCPG
jgi:hypothetical protein